MTLAERTAARITRDMNTIKVMSKLVRLRAPEDFGTVGIGGVIGVRGATYPVIDGYVTALWNHETALLECGFYDDTPKKPRKPWTRRAKLPAHRLTLVVNNNGKKSGTQQVTS